MKLSKVADFNLKQLESYFQNNENILEIGKIMEFFSLEIWEPWLKLLLITQINEF